MTKKAQITIVFLWILIILAVLCLSIGNRVSLALKSAKYRTDRLKAQALAESAVKRAIVELKKDAQNDAAAGINSYDSAREKWADNKESFEKIALGRDSDGYASVNYVLPDEYGNPVTYFGTLDEERKININKAEQSLLGILLSSLNVSNNLEIAKNICAWRGDAGVTAPDYAEAGYTNKGKPFTNIQELALVKGIDASVLEKTGNYLTPAGDGKLNINTAETNVLEASIQNSIDKLKAAGTTINFQAQDLLARIMDYRKNNDFTDINIENKIDISGPYESEFRDVINGLKAGIDVHSQNFSIRASGYVRGIAQEISAVYDRQNGEIIHWHE